MDLDLKELRMSTKKTPKLSESEILNMNAALGIKSYHDEESQ